MQRHAETRRGPDGKGYLSLSGPHVARIAAATGQSLRQVEMEALSLGIVPERYQRNLGAITAQGQIRLLQSRAAVIGAGGLGGAVLELLARMGVGQIVAADGDSFAESNLNRQLLSDAFSLGQNKAMAAGERLALVNPAVEVTVHPVFAGPANLPSILNGCQVVIDALDRIPERLTLQEAAAAQGIPLVHGALAGFMGQVMTVLPGDAGLRLVYQDGEERGAEVSLGAPGITPMAVAACQVSEAMKLLLGWEPALRGRLLIMDLKNMINDRIDFPV